MDEIHPDEKKTEANVQLQTEKLEKKNDAIEIIPEAIVVKKDEQTTTTTPVAVKKRKSPSVFSCFGNKKAKASKGQPTINAPSTNITSQESVQQTTSSEEEKPAVDYAILPDGKRIYIDAFRDRPGLDMSYKPDDFDNRFVLPVVRIHDDDHHLSIHTVVVFFSLSAWLFSPTDLDCFVLSFDAYVFLSLSLE